MKRTRAASELRKEEKKWKLLTEVSLTNEHRGKTAMQAQPARRERDP